MKRRDEDASVFAEQRTSIRSMRILTAARSGDRERGPKRYSLHRRWNSRRGPAGTADRRRGEDLAIRVLDSGPGVPEEALDKIFDLFTALTTRATARLAGWTGLSIADRAVRLYRRVSDLTVSVVCGRNPDSAAPAFALPPFLIHQICFRQLLSLRNGSERTPADGKRLGEQSRRRYPEFLRFWRFLA